MISPGIFLYFFYFFIFVNIKMLTFFIGPLQQFFFNKWLFFKFLNKCQTEILGCAPPSSHVCDFYFQKWLISTVSSVLKAFLIMMRGFHLKAYEGYMGAAQPQRKLTDLVQDQWLQTLVSKYQWNLNFFFLVFWLNTTSFWVSRC